MSRQQEWSHSAIYWLRHLWPNHSAAIIVERLRETIGLETTRCAVIGKARRLGLVKGPDNTVKPNPAAPGFRPSLASRQLLEALRREERR